MVGDWTLFTIAPGGRQDQRAVCGILRTVADNSTYALPPSAAARIASRDDKRALLFVHDARRVAAAYQLLWIGFRSLIMERIKIVEQNSFMGTVWFGGWLFTVGYLHLLFWQGLLAVVLWPYYLGVALRGPVT